MLNFYTPGYLKMLKISIKIIIWFGFIFPSIIKAQSIGGTTSGSALYCDTTNTGFISLNGQVGNVLYWQYSINNGSSWVNISNNSTSQSYNYLKLTTDYRAIVQNGLFTPDTSTISSINVYVGNTGNITGGGAFCSNSGSGTINLNGHTGNVINWEFSTNGGLMWNNIPNNTSTIAYSNITQNTLYRAIIQTIVGCPNDTSKTSSFIIDNLTVAGTILKNDTVCNGDNKDSLKISGSVGSIIDWLTSTDNGTIWSSTGINTNYYEFNNLTQQVWYKAIVKNGVCNTQTTTPISIAIYSITPVNAGLEAIITQYESTTLAGSGIGNPSWNPTDDLDNPNSFNPSASPANTTTYTLTLTNSNGCLSTDTVTIKVIIPLPNTITPNDDGVNDFFIINKINEHVQNSLLIYNRWGMLVYKKAPYNNEWNGKSLSDKDLPDDIYYYVLDYGNGEKPITNFILINR